MRSTIHEHAVDGMGSVYRENRENSYQCPLWHLMLSFDRDSYSNLKNQIKFFYFFSFSWSLCRTTLNSILYKTCHTRSIVCDTIIKKLIGLGIRSVQEGQLLLLHWLSFPYWVDCFFILTILTPVSETVVFRCQKPRLVADVIHFGQTWVYLLP